MIILNLVLTGLTCLYELTMFISYIESCTLILFEYNLTGIIMLLSILDVNLYSLSSMIPLASRSIATHLGKFDLEVKSLIQYE